MGFENFDSRPLTPEQLGSWADLYTAILEADEDDDILGEEDLADEFADPLVDYDRGSIAVYDGDVMVAYNVVTSSSTADPVHEMRQDGGVRLEYRGRGLGSDLLDWSLSIARGNQQWKDSKPQSWNDDVKRFHTALAAFDDYLAADQPLQAPVERLLQGPVADALTHVGQIAMMRRLAGSPVKSENFFAADIAAGRVGPDQTLPKFEF